MSWKVIECELTDHLLSFMWPSKSIEMAVGVKEIPRLSPARAWATRQAPALVTPCVFVGMAGPSDGFAKSKTPIFL